MNSAEEVSQGESQTRLPGMLVLAVRWAEALLLAGACKCL